MAALAVRSEPLSRWLNSLIAGENTGNFRQMLPLAQSYSLEEQAILRRIPWSAEQGIFPGKQGNIIRKEGKSCLRRLVLVDVFLERS
jgi:hypothetical protein